MHSEKGFEGAALGNEKTKVAADFEEKTGDDNEADGKFIFI